VILTAGRRGTFVRADASREVERIKSNRAERKVEQVVSALLGEGVTGDEIAALFKDALRVARTRTKETTS
jgi:DNA-binding transcriptional regulator YhcF (GntR family)